MTRKKTFKIQIEIDDDTGLITKALIDRDGLGSFEEVELDKDALIEILKSDGSRGGVLANRTGPDPRRLSPD